MAGSLLYALLRAVLEAVAVARTDWRTLEAEPALAFTRVKPLSTRRAHVPTFGWLPLALQGDPTRAARRLNEPV